MAVQQSPHALTHQEINALACAMRSGIEPALGTAERMLATIRDLQRELLTQTQRTAQAMQSDAAAMERLCERVLALEGHLAAVIDERLRGDNRAPQPALFAACEYLRTGLPEPGTVAAVVESRVPDVAAAGRGEA